MEIKEDLTYKKNKYRSLEDCKKCKKHKGIYMYDFIRCNIENSFIGLVIMRPAFYDEGHTNGEKIVMCKRGIEWLK